MQSVDCRIIFEDIYARNSWHSGDGSGHGSTPPWTEQMVPRLTQMIERCKIRSLLDAPCGSCFWTKELVEVVQRTDPSFEYVGIDVSATAVERARRNMSRLPNVKIFEADLSTWDNDARQTVQGERI